MIQISLIGLIVFFSSVYGSDVTFTRDPFQAIWSMEETASISLDMNTELVVRLKGIVWDKDDPAAVLEFNRLKKIVYTGDVIGYITVISISKDQVTFSSKSKIIVVKLGQEVQL